MGVIGTSVGLARARINLNAARASELKAIEAQKKEAEEARQAEAVATVLESTFQSITPMSEENAIDFRTQLLSKLDNVAATLEKDYAGEPLVRARLRKALGISQMGLGEWAKAETLLKSAIEEQRLHGSPGDLNLLLQKEALATVYLRNSCGYDPVRTRQAIALLEEVRLQASRPLPPEHSAFLNILGNLALGYLQAGRNEESVKLFQQVLDNRERILGDGDPRTIESMASLAHAYLHADRTSEAMDLYERVREQQRRTLGADDVRFLETLNHLALAYIRVGRIDDAIRLFEQVGRGWTDKLGGDYPGALVALFNLAIAYDEGGHADEAIKILEQLKDKLFRKFGPDAPETQGTLSKLVDVYQKVGRNDDAARLLGLATVPSPGKAGARNDQPDTFTLAYARSRYHRRFGEFRPAEAELLRCLVLEPQNHQARYELACLQRYLGEDQAYRETCRELLRRFGDTSDRAISDRTAKACLLMPGAVPDLAPVLRLAEQAATEPLVLNLKWGSIPQVVRGSSGFQQYFDLCMGLAEYRRGNWASATDWLRSSRDIFSRILSHVDPRHVAQFSYVEAAATANFYLAMARHRLSDEPGAREALAQAWVLFHAQVPTSSSGHEHLAFEDWLIVQIAAREAEAMFGSSPYQFASLQESPGHQTGSSAAGPIETVRAVKALASAYGAAGNSEALADTIITMLEPLRKPLEKLTANREDLLTTMELLGQAYQSKDRPIDAVGVLQQALELKKEMLGPENNQTLATMRDLYIASRAAGKTAEALELSTRLRTPLQKAVMDDTKAITTQPSNPTLLADRGKNLARLGRFQEAADDFAKCVALAPENHHYWHEGLVPLLLELKDEEGFIKRRTQELRQFRDIADPVGAHRVAKDAFMRPIEGEDLRIAAELADRGLNPIPRPYGWQTKGMAEYRSGHYEEAVQSFQKARAVPGYQKPIADLFLAMSYEHLEDHARATAALARAVRVIEIELPQPGAGDFLNFQDLIVARIVRREAEELINRRGRRLGATTQPIVSK